MSKDAVLTKLIVGDPFTVDLGIPVGQQLEESSGSALRWSEGDWLTGDSLPATLTHQSAIAPETRTAPVPAKTARRKFAKFHRLAWVGAGLAGVVLVGVVAWYVARSTPALTAATSTKVVAHASTSVASAPSVAASAVGPIGVAASASAPLPPVLPVPEAGPDVRVVDQAYQVPDNAPPETKLPIAPKEVVAAAESKLPKPVAQTQAHRAAEPDAKAPAVVLDDSSLKQTSAAPSNKPAPAPPQPIQAAPARGTVLVAITPDGKAAVFANPKSRLPEQFKVGDRLPSGETVRTIDAKQGRVTTSAKEYSLE